MRQIILIFLSLFSFTIHSQNVEIQGDLKVTTMNNNESVESLVVRDGNGTLYTRTAASLGLGAPSGSILIWPSDTPPAGWKICDGSSLDVSSFADLFAVIGYQFGGSGSEFNLPNLQQKIPVGVSSNTGYSLGDEGGQESETVNFTPQGTVLDHTLSVSEMPSHSHSNGQYSYLLRYNGTGTINSSSTDNNGFEPNLNSMGEIQNAGGGQPHSHGFQGTASDINVNVVQPYIALNYIIKE